MRKSKIEIKQKHIGPIKKRIFDPPLHKKKNKKNETCSVKIDRVEAEIQAYTHTDIFQKPCILFPNTSENNYNKFLRQHKKLLSQSFLWE